MPASRSVLSSSLLLELVVLETQMLSQFLSDDDNVILALQTRYLHCVYLCASHCLRPQHNGEKEKRSGYIVIHLI